MAGKPLTTRAVALLLGVSEATVKRWADDGLLSSEKTVGGHRRFSFEEVARFQRQQGLGLNQAATRAKLSSTTASAPQRLKVSASAIFEALVAGDQDETAALLINAYLHDVTLAGIFDKFLCVAMRRVGDLWSTGELTIAQEHLATRTAINALYALNRVLVVPEKKELRAICCCIEEDYHELPAHLTQAILESEGWSVINLGANTPFFALTEAAVRHQPNLVCVSSTVLFNPDRAAREYGEFRLATSKKGIMAALGGEGFADKKFHQRFPAELHADNFEQLKKFLAERLT